MMVNNLVSIIMPAYNAESYIASAIDSILKQSYQNWELLVVNDASKDATGEIRLYCGRAWHFVILIL